MPDPLGDLLKKLDDPNLGKNLDDDFAVEEYISQRGLTYTAPQKEVKPGQLFGRPSYGPGHLEDIERARPGTVWGAKPVELDGVADFKENWPQESQDDLDVLVRSMSQHPNFRGMGQEWMEQKGVGMLLHLRDDLAKTSEGVGLPKLIKKVGIGARAKGLGLYTKPKSIEWIKKDRQNRYRQGVEKLVSQMKRGYGATRKRDDEWGELTRPDYSKADDPLMKFLGGTDYYPSSPEEQARKAKIGKLGVDNFLKTNEGKRYKKIANNYIDAILAGDPSSAERDLMRVDQKKWSMFEYIVHEQSKRRPKKDRNAAVRFFGGLAQWGRTGPRTVVEGYQTIIRDPFAETYGGDEEGISRLDTKRMGQVTRLRQIVMGEILPTGPTEDAGHAEKVLLYGGQMVPDMAVSAILFAAGTAAGRPAVGAGASMAYWWARITPDLRNRLEELGVDDAYAGPLAAAGGFASAYIEQMQIKKLLPKGIVGATTKGARDAAEKRIIKEMAEGGKLWFLAKRAGKRTAAGVVLGGRETAEEFMQAVVESGTAGIGDYLDGVQDGWTATEEWKDIKRQTEQGAYAVSFMILVGRGLPGLRRIGKDADLKDRMEKLWGQHLKVMEQQESERARRNLADSPLAEDTLEDRTRRLDEQRRPDMGQPVEEPGPLKEDAPRRLSPEELADQNPEAAQSLLDTNKKDKDKENEFLDVTWGGRENVPEGEGASSKNRRAYLGRVRARLRANRIAAEDARRERVAEEREEAMTEAARPTLREALPAEEWAVPEEGGVLTTRDGGEFRIKAVADEEGVRKYTVENAAGEAITIDEGSVYNIERAGEAPQPTDWALQDATTVQLRGGDFVLDAEGRTHTVDHVTATRAGEDSVVTTEGEQLTVSQLKGVVIRKDRKPSERRRPRQWPRPDAAEEAEQAEQDVAAEEAEVTDLIGQAAEVTARVEREVEPGFAANQIAHLAERAKRLAEAGDPAAARRVLDYAQTVLDRNLKPAAEPAAEPEPLSGEEIAAIQNEYGEMDLEELAAEVGRLNAEWALADEAGEVFHNRVRRDVASRIFNKRNQTNERMDSGEFERLEAVASQAREDAHKAPEPATDPIPAVPTERVSLPERVRAALGEALKTLIAVEPGEMVEPDMDPEALDLISQLEKQAVSAFEGEEGVKVTILAEPGGIPARRRAGVYHNGVAYLVRESLDLKTTDTRDQALNKIRRNYQRVLAEELTHHLQDVDPATAQSLWEHSIAEDPDGVWDSLEEYAEKAGWKLPERGNWDALSSLQIAEAQANYVADHMGDGLFWNRIAKKDRNLFQRIIDAIRTLFSNLRGRTTVDPVTGKRRQISGQTYRMTMDAVLGATGVAVDADADIKGRAAIGDPAKLSEVATSFDDIAAAIKANGGITINLWTGKQPAKGWSVAPWKDTETKIPEEQFGDQDVRDFIKDWWHLLKVDGIHFGGWLKEGNIHLDASIVLPNKMDAAAVGDAGDQKAIFNLKTYEEPTLADIRKNNAQELEEATKRLEAGPTSRSLIAARERVARAIHREGAVGVQEGRAPEAGERPARAAVGEPLDYRAGRAIAALEGANRGNRPSTPIGLGREEYAKDKRHHVAIAADLVMDSGAKLDDYWAVISGVYGPWKGIGSDRTNFYKQVNQYVARAKATRGVGKPPKGTRAAGGLHREFLVEGDPKVGRAAKDYLIPANMGDVRKSMVKDYRTPTKIAAKQRDSLSALNRLLDEHPDPFSDYDSALRFMTDLYRTGAWVPSPPMNVLAMRKDPGIGSALLKGLNEDQVANSEHGLAAAQRYRERLADGSMTADHTAMMAGWGILSRMLSPYTHESAAMHLMMSPVAQQIVRDAVQGDMKLRKKTDIRLDPATGKPDLDKNDNEVYYTFRSDSRYEKIVKSLGHMIPEGSPGRPGIANLNSFFREFLPLMQRKHPSGVTYLQRMHEIFADQSISGVEARRQLMMEMPPGNGIQSKVWSFLLLLTGRTDVLVIDRVQARNLWDDGSFSHISNLYDGFKSDGLSVLVNDFKAIPLYEALERSLEPIMLEMFERAGVSDPSMGKFHWMSWNAASFQEAGHGSLDYLYGTISNDQVMMGDAAAIEGRYNFTEYGATYYPMDPITGEGHKILWDPGALGYAYEFKDVEEFKAFQSWIKTAGSFTSDRKLGRVQTGGESVLPLEWRLRTERGGPKLMKVNGLNPKAIPELESRPWIFAEGVDLDAINQRAGELDTVRYDARAGESFTTRLPKPKRRSPVRRAAGEEVSPEERAAARAEARAIPSVDPTVRGVSAQITEEMYLGGRNYTTTLEPFREQAVEAVTLDFMGETRRLLDLAAAGQGYGSNLDTAIANELHNRWIDKAVSSGHLPKAEQLKIWEQTRQVVEAVRITRGVIATFFRQMHDPFKAARRRKDNVLPLHPIARVDALTESVLEGTTSYQVAKADAEAKLKKARKEGVTKGVKAQQARLVNLERRWNTAFRKLRDKLEAEGMDISNISDIARDPVRAQQMLNRIEAINQNILDHAFHFKRNMALSALTTTGVDVFSTVGFGAYAMGFERGMEALQNSARKMIGREIDYDAATWAEFKDVMSGMGPAIRKAFKNAIQSFMTEKPVLQRYVDQSGELTGRFGSMKTGGGFGWKWPGRIVRAFGYSRLLFTDEFAQTFIGYTEVGAMARRLALQSGIKSGTDEMKAYIENAISEFSHPAWQMGLDRARRATFQLPQGEIVEGIKKVAHAGREIPVIGPGYLRFQAMFLDTPINIIAESVSMSPLGIFHLLLDYGFKRRSNGGNGIPNVSRRVMQQLVNGIAMLGFYYAYDPEDPIITGTQSVWGWDERKLHRRTIPPMSIKVPFSEDEKGNAKYMDYSRVEPVSMILATMIDLVAAWKRGPDTPKKLELAGKQAVLTMADVTLNKSYLKQFSDIMEIWTAHDEKRIFRMLADYQSRQAATYIPNILKHGLKHGDATFAQRTVHGVTDDEFYSRLAKRTIQRTELHRWFGVMKDTRKYDDWGRPMKTSESIGFLSPHTSRMLVPSFIKRVDTFVGDDILRTYSFNNPDDERNTKRVHRDYTNAEGERVGMTDPQLDQAEQAMGAVARELTILYTSHFTEDQRMKPTEEMADLVMESMASGRGEAKRFLVANWNKGKELPTDWKQVARDLYDRQVESKANAAASATARYNWRTHGRGAAGRAVHAEMKKEKEKSAGEAIEWLKLRGFEPGEIRFKATKKNKRDLIRRLLSR